MTDPLEDRLRAGLRDAASQGPAFEVPDLSDPGPDRRRHRPVVLAAAGLVVAGAVAVTALAVLDDPPGGGGAACAFVVRWEGRTWTGIGSDRTPVTGEVLGEGVVPRCDDGNGASEQRQVEVRRIRGVDPAQAVVVNGAILLPDDAEGLPRGLEDAQRPVVCRLAGTVELVGRWTGVVSSREARFDGDVRAPYRIDFVTEDPRVTEGYARVRLEARGTVRSRPLRAEQVQALLGGESEDLLTTHCRGERFVVDALGAP